MRSFSSQINQRQPIMTVNEILNKKYDFVHQQMYEHALSEYFSYAGISKDDYRTVEIPSSYYDSPSRLQLIEKTFPYRRKVIDLTPFWESYKFKESISYLKIDDETILTSEVKYRDYVRGTAEIESRMTGVKYKAALKDIPEDMKDYPDDNSIEHTFGYKLQNKIYGEW